MSASRVIDSDISGESVLTGKTPQGKVRLLSYGVSGNLESLPGEGKGDPTHIFALIPLLRILRLETLKDWKL